MNSTPFYLVFLICFMAVPFSGHGTTLFDSQRGKRESSPETGIPASQGQTPGLPARAGNRLQPIRLDGVLTLDNMHRVLLTGPKGESYRFVWEGRLTRVLPFEGENADQLSGYGLVSADQRAVWLQLPPGAQCAVEPEKGVVDCRNGQAKLAMVKRTPPASPPLKRVDKKVRPTGNPFQRLRPRPKLPTQGKSQAFLDAEALKERFKEAARRKKEEDKVRQERETPPGFKVDRPLFGKSSLVKDTGSKQATTRKVAPAVERAKTLKNQYRQQNQQLLQQGYKGSFGFGQVPKTAE